MTDDESRPSSGSRTGEVRQRHKTLSAYYSSLYKLGDFLFLVLKQTQPQYRSTNNGENLNDNHEHNDIGTCRRTISKPNDSKAYQALLSDTICAFRSEEEKTYLRIALQRCITNNKGSRASRTGASTSSKSQQEAIDCISREMIKLGQKNILVAGNRFPAVDLPINISRPNIDNRHVNSPSSVLRSTEWKLLRSRIGDEAFQSLLLHSSLFLPVGNNCYTQLSGEPIYDLYDHAKFARTDAPDGDQAVNTGLDPRAAIKSRSSRKRRRDALLEENCDSHKKTRNLKRLLADVKIPRQRIYYGHASKTARGKILYGLPPSHMFYTLKSTMGAGHVADIELLKIAQSIFPSLFRHDNDNDGTIRVKGSKARLEGVLGMISELVARHRKIDFRDMLKRSVCREDLNIDASLCGVDHKPNPSLPVTQVFPESPVEEDHKPSRHVKADATIPPLLQAVSHGQVCRYITLIFRQLLSLDIMGSQHNLDTLIGHAKRFVRAKQFEPVNLHYILQGIRVNDVKWTSIDPTASQRVNPSEASRRKALVENCVEWIFTDFMIPLLRNTFYITETSTTRYETVYYTHEDWSRATKPHMEGLKDDLLTTLNKTESYFAQQGPLGVSAVRLIPKPKGFRPIVNLGKKIKSKNLLGIPVSGSAKRDQTANQVLKGVHQILTFEKDRHKASLGASLFGTNEIFAPLQSLKSDLISKYGKIPKLYFVKMDIKAAFDTIKQDKMIDVVSRLLDKNHDYCVMLHCLLLPPASKASHGASRRLFKSKAVLDDHVVSSFGEHVQEIAKPLRNAVIVDLVRRKRITKEACLELLRLHIQKNVWQIGKTLYKQKVGIPQGSKISSLLCSFFYACMENEFLAFTRQSGSRLLRYIDDFLFISDSPTLARRFVNTMSKGFPAYGAEVSLNKTLLSFECESRGQMATVVNVGVDGQTLFPYCGFLLNTQTLDVMGDHPRLLTGPIKQSFALRSDRHKGSAFIGWFSRQLENRNHVAYLDTMHNDIDTVHLNIFINFASTSMKIPYYFKSDELNSQNQRRERMIVDAVITSAEYTYMAGRARVKHASRADERDHYRVKRNDFIVLALNAIVLVLEKKSRFRGITHLLKGHLREKRYRRAQLGLSDVIRKGWEAVKEAKY
ncbi:uncharacterized protein I303_108570 [Kwoniella dejecticola CBS 10117]|uniref:Telomerase reverse transcriptase n=1 Tax=Kwoniella dejecticola CBS 10117 TaxID=1296121 RepID=A0AAJ8MLP8_9TREE